MRWRRRRRRWLGRRSCLLLVPRQGAIYQPNGTLGLALRSCTLVYRSRSNRRCCHRVSLPFSGWMSGGGGHHTTALGNATGTRAFGTTISGMFAERRLRRRLRLRRHRRRHRHRRLGSLQRLRRLGRPAVEVSRVLVSNRAAAAAPSRRVT